MNADTQNYTPESVCDKCSTAGDSVPPANITVKMYIYDTSSHDIYIIFISGNYVLH